MDEWQLNDERTSKQTERRRARHAPKAKLWPDRLKWYPALYPAAWYAVYTAVPPDPRFVWLRTAHGLTRVSRSDVEVRAVTSVSSASS